MADETREERLVRLRNDRRPGPHLTPEKPVPQGKASAPPDGVPATETDE